LAAPPSRDQLARIASQLPAGARSLINPNKVGEEAYQRYLAGREQTISEEELLDVFATYPDLLLKPIVLTPHGVSVGFDPERLENLWRQSFQGGGG